MTLLGTKLRWRLAAATLATSICATAVAQTPTTPAAATTQADAVDPAVEKILDRVQARGDSLDTISAKLHVKLVETLVDETTDRDGSVQYLRKWEPNAAAPKDGPHAGQAEHVYFRVQFDTRKTAGYVSTKKEVYSFDGRWLHILNETSSQVTHQEIVPEGQLINPTKLGKGPFPAPFGQQKADVLGSFRVKLIAPVSGDPKETDHLELTPRPGTDLARTYQRIDQFIDRKLELPVRIVLTSEDKVQTVDLSDVKINDSKVTIAGFEIKKPAGWAEAFERLQPGEKPVAPK